MRTKLTLRRKNEVSAEPHRLAKRRLAAIDIGSNSVRLLIAEVSPDGSYRVLDDEKRTTRLAHGLAATRLLSNVAIHQTLEALVRMKAIAAGYGVEQLRVVATSAVREAVNRDLFLKLVRQRLGLEVRVISSEEEGMLSFESAARHLDLRHLDSLVVDLGGGSVELVFAAKGVVEHLCSLPLGAVRLTEEFVRSDPSSEAELRRLRKHVVRIVERAAAKPVFQPQVMIGAGGTFTALANISLRRRGAAPSQICGYEMNRSEVRHIAEHLQALPLRGRRAVPGLNPDRAEIIVAGLIVIERLMKVMRVNRLLIHDQGVRDGLLLRMIGERFKEQPCAPAREEDALASAWQFAVSCGVDQKHTQHVSHLSGKLFRQLQASLRLPDSDLLILQAAALLHEVGNLINYQKHHHHAYHLILHGNFRGLSPRQRELAANVARYHRRSGPKMKHENFARLSPEDRKIVQRLSALLRVADGLDRSHTQRVKDVYCRRRGDRLYVTVQADDAPDVDLWGAAEKGKLFKKVFGLELRFSWSSQPPKGPHPSTACSDTNAAAKWAAPLEM